MSAACKRPRAARDGHTKEKPIDHASDDRQPQEAPEEDAARAKKCEGPNGPLPRITIDDAAGQEDPRQHVGSEERSDWRDLRLRINTLLKLSSVGAKPMMAGENVVARPEACDVNSCHQS